MKHSEHRTCDKHRHNIKNELVSPVQGTDSVSPRHYCKYTTLGCVLLYLHSTLTCFKLPFRVQARISITHARTQDPYNLVNALQVSRLMCVTLFIFRVHFHK